MTTKAVKQPVKGRDGRIGVTLDARSRLTSQKAVLSRLRRDWERVPARAGQAGQGE